MVLEETTEPALFGGNDSTMEKVTSRLAEQNGRYAVLAPEGGRYSGPPT
ncbi:hypothetical protein [Actinomadura macrotermitis]|uniref:Uncharacterized protein n=1 Tax=Actinomadura macrotermitis TaxID=2585200 RepID=A0A7K0BLM6_9ACTN|nr:hypothetical protein [Actinomadura macrotermitis]MQY02083.1 hypothetical protein [Actinomadura macrotermitis]